MDRRESCLNRIELALRHLRVAIELRNSINLYDVNIIAENFYRDFLNKLYPSSEYYNLNAVDKNAVAIDLGDDATRTAIQITSDNTSGKIHKTLKKFVENKYHEKFDTLKVLIITNKKEYTTDFSKSEGSWSFSNEDVIDLKDLLKLIENLDGDHLESIAEFLEKEAFFRLKKANQETNSNEVETIISLLEYLSNPKNIDIIDDSETDPDPEKKIFSRFSDYSNFLTQMFSELHSIYSSSLYAVEENINSDSVSIKKRQLFLKFKSVELLEENNGNPKDALDALTRLLETKLRTKNIQYDYTAIKFFLINELIKCNVFPNPVNNE